jgi:2-polyprenyl-3-methyl-5-hydroxy-6-metoxy-1,4-benzoquinol methylase
MSKKENNTRKEHWEQIYRTKKDNEVSWYQSAPNPSLQLIQSLVLARDAEIIDIGGGNSNLAGKLLEEGYRNLSVLDLSANALERSQLRLGEKAKSIRWIVTDVLQFEPGQGFDLWHDRAVFHFLVIEDEIKRYAAAAAKLVRPNGYLIVGSFSTTGPKKCSGLDITQYSEQSMRSVFAADFHFIESVEHVHTTPFETQQNFIYGIFKRNPPGEKTEKTGETNDV